MRHERKLTCESFRRELSNFLDDDIEPTLGESIQPHLRNCPPCAALHDSLRNILALFRDERLVEVPAGYSERLHAFLTDRMRE